MKSFEDAKYNEWRTNTENILPDLLKSNLLIKPRDMIEHNLVLPVNKDPETGKLMRIHRKFLNVSMFSNNLRDS
jgi:hypothetical protein